MSIICDYSLKQARKDVEHVNKSMFDLFMEPINMQKKNYALLKPQLFTNENSRYIGSMNQEGTSLLAVAAGFDSIIDFVSSGTKDVVAIDVNPRQLHIGFLKLWALESLTYEEFKGFLINPKSDLFMKSGVFKDIMTGIPDSHSSKYYWMQMQGSMLPYSFFGKCFYDQNELYKEPDIVLANYVNDEDAYNKAKENIRNANIRFIHGDVRNIGRMGLSKFDNIVLSNVGDYIANGEYFELVTKDVMSHLSSDGVIMPAYLIEFSRLARKLHCSKEYKGLAGINPTVAKMNGLVDMFREIGGELEYFDTGHGRGSYVFSLGEETDAAIILRK